MEDYGMDIEKYWEFEEYVGYRASASDYLPDEDIPCPTVEGYTDDEEQE